MQEMLFLQEDETGGKQGTSKIGRLKPVFHWVLEQSLHERVVEQPPDWLLCKEEATWPQHTVSLSQNVSPLGDVVNDAKVKHCIVGGVPCVDGGGIANPKPHLRPARTQPPLRHRHHPWIQVEGVNGGSPEEIQNHLRADAPTTTELQSPRAGHRAAHP